MFKRFLFSLAAVALAASPAAATAPEEPCLQSGIWLDPATGKHPPAAQVIETMAARPAVFLGETHTNPEHHRWQLQTLAALHGRKPNMVLAFEMFPRSAQPVLDAWVRGELTAEAFLDKVAWDEVWAYDPDFYLPLFHFARMHRIPMVAMNVDQALIRAVRQDGWDQIPEVDREGVTDPVPPPEAYEDMLYRIFKQHVPGDEDGAPGRDSRDFRNFLDAQVTWDRAMAEAVAGVRQGGGEPLVVGIVGAGHLNYGHGIPHQLQALGVEGAAVLLPWETDQGCGQLRFDGAGVPIADRVFGVAPWQRPEKPDRPLLGVMIEALDEGTGVRVGRVLEDSVAEETGLQEGDVIVSAAGFPVGETDDLITIVGRQAPGTWLPMKVRRGDATLDMVARFPARSEPPEMPARHGTGDE